jgi:glycosyltransferase involved in cell wall biosynthesis
LRFAREIGLRYLRRFHNRTRCTMVPTEEMKRRLAESEFARLTVLGRGVDGRLFTPQKRSEELRASWGVAPDDPVAIYVGRMAAEKNLGVVVKSFLALQAMEPRAKLVLVGDGPQRPALAAKYPGFHYAGTRRGEELAAHYASADLFLFASVTETFGNVITEAMASGLAVLSYDYAAAREYIQNGQNGFTAPLGNEEAFIQVAQDALMRRGAWPTIKARARATAERITWDSIVLRFEEELSSAMQTGEKSGRETGVTR